MARTRYASDQGPDRADGRDHVPARAGVRRIFGRDRGVPARAVQQRRQRRHRLHRERRRADLLRRDHRRRQCARFVLLVGQDRAAHLWRPAGQPEGRAEAAGCTASSTGCARWPTCPSRGSRSRPLTCRTRSRPGAAARSPCSARPGASWTRTGWTTKELEGVLAHEMSHVAHKDVAVMTIASFLGIIAGADGAVRVLLRAVGGGGRGREQQQPERAAGHADHAAQHRRLRRQLPADQVAVPVPRAVRRPVRRAADRASRRRWPAPWSR